MKTGLGQRKWWKGFVALTAACGVALVQSPASGLAADCPNEALRASQASAELPQGTVGFPSCLALEMLSPPHKFGQEIPEVVGFSSDGRAALFTSKAALSETPGQQSLTGDRYVGTLTDGGWVPTPTSPPAQAEIVHGGTYVGGPFAYRHDLKAWVGYGATQRQKTSGEGQVYIGGPDSFGPLSPVLKPIDDDGDAEVWFFVSNFRTLGASADLSTAVFGPHLSSTALLPDDPRWEDGKRGHANTYLSYLDGDGEPVLELLARDRFGTVYGAGCGSNLGGGGRTQGAIAPDGSRLYFTTRPDESAGTSCDEGLPQRIMARTLTPDGPVIEELPDAGGIGGGSDQFQGASLDTERAYLVSPRNLVAADQDPGPSSCSSVPGESDGCDLYLYDWGAPPGSRLTLVSHGDASDPQPGQGADVLAGTVAISGDGSRVYFAAEGVLTTSPNPEGEVAAAGKPNLYAFDADSDEIAFVGTLAESDRGQVWGGGSLTGSAYAVPLGGPDGAGGSGSVLLFATDASLVPGDQDGGRRDLYRYDADAESLEWLSKPESGGPSAYPADVVVNPNETAATSDIGQIGRWVSEDGGTVAFATAEPLVEGAPNGVSAYVLKDGALARIPTVVERRPQRPVVSMDGEAIGFTTTERLLARDGDTARDAYVLRVDGGFPEPPPPDACDPLSGECQGEALPLPPPLPTASSSFFGPGNPPQRPACKGNRVRRNNRCVPRRCKRGLVRRKGRCVRKRHCKRRKARQGRRCATKAKRRQAKRRGTAKGGKGR